MQVRLFFFSSFSAAFSGSLTQGEMLGCFSPACELVTSAPWSISGLYLCLPSLKPLPITPGAVGTHRVSVVPSVLGVTKTPPAILGDGLEWKTLNTHHPNHSLQHQDPKASPSANPTRQILTGTDPGTTQAGLSLAQHPPAPSDCSEHEIPRSASRLSTRVK